MATSPDPGIGRGGGLATRDLPTGTVTFFFSDIEGSTRLLTAMGERFAALRADHQRLIRESFAAFGGVEVSTEGDSFFCAFRSPFAAVQAAAAAQLGLAAHPWPESAELRVRIGLHTGQGVMAGADYVGIDVHRAARIAAAGHGGQVLISETTRVLVQGDLPGGVALRDLGRHRLKDIGTQHLWELVIAGLPSTFGSLRSLEAHPFNLPNEVTRLVDREAELRALSELVRAGPLVTVTGAGGIGKSRLALRVGHELRASFPDGVFRVDLAAMDRAEIAASELATEIEGHLDPARPAVDVLIEELRDRHLLVLFDTADRVRDMPEVLARIVAICPRVRVLVTSRSPMHLTSEHEFHLQPLTVADPSTEVDLAGIAASPAVELFVQRAQAVRPEFELTTENAGTIARICVRLDGLPLALELAAARIRLLTPEAMLSRLERRLPLLTGAAQDAPDRQRTLRDTIAWSYGLLEPDERSVLQRLAVFAGSFELSGAEAVAQRDVDPLDMLERLVDRSLIVTVEGPGEPRFRLLGTIREFALEELAHAGEAEAGRDAHARYWLQVARSSAEALRGPDDVATVARLKREVDEFRAALDWTIGSQAEARPSAPVTRRLLGLGLAASLGRFWWLRGDVREGIGWLDRSLSVAPEADPGDRAEAHFWAGVLRDEAREAEAAANDLEEALRLQRTLGDEAAIARTLNSLGVVARTRGDLDRAEQLLSESLARKQALGEEHGLASPLSNLGIIALDRGRLEDSRRFMEQALELDIAAGAHGMQAYSRFNLGAVQIRAGQVVQGVANVRASLGGVADAGGDPDLIADCVEQLGEAALALDEPTVAARLLLAADVIRERHSLPLRAIDQGRVDAVRARLASAIDSTAMEAARAEALAMDLDGAVAYGLAVSAGWVSGS